MCVLYLGNGETAVPEVATVGVDNVNKLAVTPEMVSHENQFDRISSSKT